MIKRGVSTERFENIRYYIRKLNINKRKTNDLCTCWDVNIKTQLIIGALKLAEFPDHISIDYGVANASVGKIYMILHGGTKIWILSSSDETNILLIRFAHW